jgi:tripartite-type tricarboxylate transporter receptor subunit TctC
VSFPISLHRRRVARSFAAATLAAAGFAVLPAHQAQAAYPEKPVVITVGFGAGGTTDVVARVVGEVVSKHLGQPVVIENRAGAGGAVAATMLTKLPADGYNLVATTSTTITLDPQIGKLAFGLDDFTYVAAIGEFPEAYIALPEKGWKTLKDATAAAKKAGSFNVASSTSLDRMITAYIAKHENTKLAVVPTKSGAEVVTQVMGGHVDLGYSSGAYYPQAKAGKLAVLGVLGEKRVAGLPDVPTLKEIGYDVSSVNLILFVAPKGLPKDVAAKLDAAFAAAGKDPAILDLLEKRSVNAFIQTGAPLADTIRQHAKGYARLIEATK